MESNHMHHTVLVKMILFAYLEQFKNNNKNPTAFYKEELNCHHNHTYNNQ